MSVWGPGSNVVLNYFDGGWTVYLLGSAVVIEHYEIVRPVLFLFFHIVQCPANSHVVLFHKFFLYICMHLMHSFIVILLPCVISNFRLSATYESLYTYVQIYFKIERQIHHISMRIRRKVTTLIPLVSSIVPIFY